MLDEAWALFYKENDMHIAASVYSDDGQEHDKITGVTGSHEKTARALAFLKEKEIPFRTAAVCMDGICLGEVRGDLFSLEGKQGPARPVGRVTFKLMNKKLNERKMITRQSHFSRLLHKSSAPMAMRRHNCFGPKLYLAADLEVYPRVIEHRFCRGSLRDKPRLNCCSRKSLN